MQEEVNYIQHLTIKNAGTCTVKQKGLYTCQSSTTNTVHLVFKLQI